MAKLLTVEQHKFLQENVAKLSNQDLTNLINKKFNSVFTVNQIKSYKKNHGIKSNLTGRFEKGHIPVNKGKKFPGMVNRTTFKKGRCPQNYQPIGSESMTKDWYIKVKIADPNKWELKHVLIWEQANGKKPKGTAIIFTDGNKRNFDLNNLTLISRKELLTMNQKGLINSNADITKTGIALAKLHVKINECKKKKTALAATSTV